jgi:hypothetical protein
VARAAGKKLRIDAIDIIGGFQESDTSESSLGRFAQRDSTLESCETVE